MNGTVSVSVSPLPQAYAGGYAILCAGESTVLNASVSGGTAPYSYAWSPSAGLNNAAILQPTATPLVPTYYVLVVTDAHGCTASDTAIVVVNPQPVADAGLDKSIYTGGATFLNGSVSGGTSPYTYQWTPAGSLNNPGILMPIATPVTTTTYVLLVTDANGCSDQDNVTVTVTGTPPGYSITGKVTYDNSLATALNNVDVTLNTGASVVGTFNTDPLGNYIFPGLANGSFVTKASTTRTWGGVNALDALLIAQYFQGTVSLSGLKLAAADVDGNSVPNANDALLVLQRSAALISSFPIGEDWLFEQKSVTIAGADVINNFTGLCYGDVNGSQFTGMKSTGFYPMSISGKLEVFPGAQVRLPITAQTTMEAGALSLGIQVPAGLRVVGVTVADDHGSLAYNVSGDMVKVEWYSLNSVRWNDGETVLYLLVEVDGPLAGSELSLYGESVAGSIRGENLGMPSLAAPKLSVPAESGYSLGNNFPNPFSGLSEIRYELPLDAQVRLSVFNLLGEEVLVLVEGEMAAGKHSILVNADQLAPGSYMYRLVARGEAGAYSQTRKMVVTR